MPHGTSRRRPQRLHHDPPDPHDPVAVKLETYERRLTIMLRIVHLAVKIAASITVPLVTGLKSLQHLV